MIVALALALVAEGRPMDSAALAHALDRLGTTARVLYVAAHPDDENTRLLAYLANGEHLEVAYLSMTRGGGGQNLIADEQGELLDVIRTQELLAARRIDGARQYFTRMPDFGYSKTAEETLELWGREAALADVVRVIRSFQPDVIITRFDERPPNHGHHIASAILAREAFEAAADPTRFPGLPPWRATRLVHNLTPWREGATPKDAIALEVGGYDPRLGASFGEIAAWSRSQHKSQGFGVPGERGPMTERFVRVAGTSGGLFDGVTRGWSRYGAAGVALQTAIDEAKKRLERDRPELAIDALLEADKRLDALPEDPRTQDARAAIAELVAGCGGLFVRATAPRPTLVPNSTAAVSLEVVLRRPAKLTLDRVEVELGAALSPAVPLELGAAKKLELAVTIPSGMAPTSTPWLGPDPTSPEGPPALEARATVSTAGRRFTLRRPVLHSWTDRVHGERLRRVTIVPPATLTPEREAVIFVGGRPAEVVVQVRAHRAKLDGVARLAVPAGWRVEPASERVVLEGEGAERALRFRVTPPKGAAPVTIAPEWDGAPALRYDLIDHPHIPVQLVLRAARLRLAPVALSVPKGLVGYVEGSGDTVANDLAHVGVDIERIDDATLEAGELARYSAIVLGIRAYNTRERLRAAQPRLMKYVEQGGQLVVQYNTNSRWDALKVPIGPYPMEIGRDRVTDERAEMVPIDPAHPVLKSPNPLGPADYEGWVQERGLYFATKLDPKYVPIYRLADPGEPTSTGALVVARHGKGQFVYTGLAFFRQLPAGVGGAYRLLLNLIARRP